MTDLTGKVILLVIPKSQFCEQELFGIRSILEKEGVRIIVLSKSGREAVGMSKTRFQPDGMIVDWNRQEGVTGKYDAVLVIGGRGAKKSLWDDPILPQILTDHYRLGSVIGAIGFAVVVLSRASFLRGEAAGPNDELFLEEMNKAGVTCVDKAVVQNERIITARGAEAVVEFSRAVLDILKNEGKA